MSEELRSGRLCVGTKKWWTERAIFSANSFMLKELQIMQIANAQGLASDNCLTNSEITNREIFSRF